MKTKATVSALTFAAALLIPMAVHAEKLGYVNLGIVANKEACLQKAENTFEAFRGFRPIKEVTRTKDSLTAHSLSNKEYDATVVCVPAGGGKSSAVLVMHGGLQNPQHLTPTLKKLAGYWSSDLGAKEPQVADFPESWGKRAWAEGTFTTTILSDAMDPGACIAQAEATAGRLAKNDPPQRLDEAVVAFDIGSSDVHDVPIACVPMADGSAIPTGVMHELFVDAGTAGTEFKVTPLGNITADNVLMTRWNGK